MKRVTMNDFRWLGKPDRWEKNYREVKLSVDGMQNLPGGPLLLAVSDEDFSLSLVTSIAPEGGFCGLCLFHSEQSYAAVGLSSTHLLLESAIHSYKTRSTLPLQTGDESITWRMEHQGEAIRIGYQLPSEESVEWVVTTTLPGMEKAVSFGPFFTNGTGTPFEATAHSLRYAKK
ncbi:hypothetical protein [Sphaerochaeta sp. PS]|uniref:hypothetical protein n=1 Tax=Sphaerochaeta sp. PS TaxID=3076336 RepID=UPI0028A3733D|nr:hypothetical protein [Sphaerochaeta sp. PS]MDT4763300.1 hypothetical protein [Sphaerochaeta sp. PS]